MNLEKGPAGERDGREIKKKLGRESLKCTHMHTHTHMKLSKNKINVKFCILRILHR